VREGISLVVLLLLWLGIPTAGAGQFLLPPCQIEIEAAHDAYLNQAYAAALDLAAPCARRDGVSDADRIRAYRLMSLSFFRQHALGEARRAITHILSIDPTYTADPVQDPPSYALLVSMVREVLAVDTDSTRLVDAVLATDSAGGRLPAAPLARIGPVTNDLATGPASFPLSAAASFSSPSQPPASAPKLLGTNGIRLTLRNRGYEQINGLNLTLWRPQPATSRGGISGLALGLPATGAARLKGIGVGLVGVTGSEIFNGIGVGGIGLTAGRLHGLALGGVGLRVDDHLHGISVNGGLTGGPGSLRGIAVSGGGVVVGGSAGGLQVGGLGVRAGDGIGGITLGGLGASSGAHLSGLTLTGGVLHAGGALRGVQATAGPVVADRAYGITAGSVVVQRAGAGLFVAPIYLHSGPDDALSGLSLSTFNHVRGRQRGLTIGLFNYAQDLVGVQLGLFNYAGNNPLLLRLLPGLNLHF
jgi:hypothetical protein